MHKKIITGILAAFAFPLAACADIVFHKNTNLTVSINANEAAVVYTALELFEKDYRNVFDGTIVKGGKAQVFIGTLGANSAAEKRITEKQLEALRGHTEGFVLEVQNDKLYILGSDKRGTAYGILELSRLIGVSPWEWWADVRSEKKIAFSLKNGYSRLEYPSVTYRGIFLNDEDFGLLPWASKNFEPGLPTVGKTKGAIGPKTYSKIFELLLRLRANMIWPAMHEVTVPFYLTKGNKEAADKYGIIVGTSHCEPLMRNSVTEWDIYGKGDYNYVTNKDAMLAYWTERLKILKGSDNIYTIGLRGKHDGMMQGVKTLAAHKKVLTEVLKDERHLLQQYVNPDVTKIPQVFVPYKEVLDVYNDGLKVPDDVTLIWCDDNYGYMTRFPNEQERARKGGNGVYYHVSYWGRPHDYLWLATNHPAQLYTQMKQAWNKGAKRLWMLNVGDIKPAEYLIELYMDMAWNIGSVKSNEAGLEEHLAEWLSRGFGKAAAKELVPVMNEYYRLAYIHKPEFMGGTRTEETDPKYKMIADLPWSESQINQRIKDYDAIEDKVIRLAKNIPAEKKDAWFELIEYPVRGAAEMNKKLLYGQLARHGKADWALSDNAFETIVALTKQYNALGNGKWRGMMSYGPRGLVEYEKLAHTRSETALIENKAPLFLFNGKEYERFTGEKPVTYGLGYQRGAISLSKGSAVVYNVTAAATDSIRIETDLAPNHPVAGKTIRYSIRVDDGPAQEVDYTTQGRSEEWKENVLNNQARRTTHHGVTKAGKHTIIIKALDEGVIVDQVKVW
ncbi:MAG: glycosyl hydrolase 115 family protein [Niabella sp.]|nr:glycosyl hydrolase 115 family protein [Niabella sp.]